METRRLVVDSGNEPVAHRKEEADTLNAWQGAALLTADCLGTGLLALPNDILELGSLFGFGFLIFNVTINYYAGYILHKAAETIEEKQVRNTPSTPITRNYQSILTLSERGRKADSTDDFIGVSSALFSDQPVVTRWIMITFYANIFLVLGNYILVMSHAVAAVIGEDRICLPEAGLLSSVGMFIISQSRTMARLGRTASIVSLCALAVVVLQCLWEVRRQEVVWATIVPPTIPRNSERANEPDAMLLLRKLSALGSIGFAVGSQKLFLNIRHELTDRKDSPKSLGVSLTAFGTSYVILCLLAGSNPPSFLFDAIPRETWNRRAAGVFLWMHVVVSYAINSQAISSSMDRLVWKRLMRSTGSAVLSRPAIRWMTLTFVLAASAYTTANAVPFFQDLLGLIGALTSVPLTLLLPALFWRKYLNVPLWVPTRDTLASIGLTYFSTIFMVVATVGSLYSIVEDWSESQVAPFACKR